MIWLNQYITEYHFEGAQNLISEAMDVYKQNDRPNISVAYEALGTLYHEKSLLAITHHDVQWARDMRSKSKDYYQKALACLQEYAPNDSLSRTRIQQALNKMP